MPSEAREGCGRGNCERAANHHFDCLHYDSYQGRDKVHCTFGSIDTCAGTAGDVSGRFIHALDWSDGGS
jgi:hypothetical protein